jgi:DNA-binding response OmpR family regulator
VHSASYFRETIIHLGLGLQFIVRGDVPDPPVSDDPKTILVVDDNAGLLSTVVAVLEYANFRVLSAACATEAIALAAKFDKKIHILLSDVEMPSMRGPDLGEELQKARPDISLIFMSGACSRSSLVLGHKLAYIQKPFMAAKLIATIEAVLRAPDRSQCDRKECDTAETPPLPDRYRLNRRG